MDRPLNAIVPLLADIFSKRGQPPIQCLRSEKVLQLLALMYSSKVGGANQKVVEAMLRVAFYRFGAGSAVICWA